MQREPVCALKALSLSLSLSLSFGINLNPTGSRFVGSPNGAYKQGGSLV